MVDLNCRATVSEPNDFDRCLPSGSRHITTNRVRRRCRSRLGSTVRIVATVPLPSAMCTTKETRRYRQFTPATVASVAPSERDPDRANPSYLYVGARGL